MVWVGRRWGLLVLSVSGIGLNINHDARILKGSLENIPGNLSVRFYAEFQILIVANYFFIEV